MSASTLRVLAYHRVLADRASPTANPSLVSATPADFERQMAHLAARYSVVSLAEVVEAQRGGAPLPPRAVLLTFDDAYRDFAEVVWPILRRHGLPATVCVATDYPDHPERVFWWDRLHHALTATERTSLHLPPFGTLRLDSATSKDATRREVERTVKSLPHDHAMKLVDRLCAELAAGPPPVGEVLGWPELRMLAREGVDLVAHTRSHAALPRLSDEEIVREIEGSITELERQIGPTQPAFCYPFGLHDDRAVAAAERAGVGIAFTCLEGHTRLPSPEPRRLRRTVITSRTSPAIFRLRLLGPVSQLDVWRKRRHAAPTPNRSAVGAPISTATWSKARPPKVAYIMSRFPKLSETFVLNEILAMEAAGVGVEVFPLLRERQPVAHPEVDRWVARASFHPFISRAILRAQAHYLRRDARAYLRTLAEVLRGTFGSVNFFVGALGIFPKSVRFAYEMERRGVTHVHAHFCTHPAVAALITHRLTGIPFSFTAHGSDLHVDRRMLAAKVEAAAFAVTISEFNREVMVSTCGERARERIHVIHCGVDLGYFTPAGARPRRRPFQLVCVASLEEVKGHRYLIDACRILRDRGWDFECHLVGDGPRRREVETRIARAGLTGRVVVHGGKPRPEVAGLLASAHAAVLASHPTSDGKKEGIPVALMEAMAAGLPVVASAISGIPELVVHEVTGLLVPSGDPAALAAGLERVLSDEVLRAQMGRAGRERVLAEFELTANTAALLRLLAPDAANAADAGPEQAGVRRGKPVLDAAPRGVGEPIPAPISLAGA